MRCILYSNEMHANETEMNAMNRGREIDVKKKTRVHNTHTRTPIKAHKRANKQTSKHKIDTFIAFEREE